MATSPNVNLTNLDLTSEEFDFDDHFQENLEDEAVREALEQGLDLRAYSKEIEEDLRRVEGQSVQDYMSASVDMATLYRQIQNCDNMLESMESMLGLFQSDLGNISGEIQSLQEQSLTMNIKLRNRKAVHASLSDYVSGMFVSDELAETICNSPIGPEFLDALKELEKKIGYVSEQKGDHGSTIEAAAELQAITAKAGSRLKEVMINKIHEVRKPMSNLQLQQNYLLGLKDAFSFLAKHNKQVAAEIRAEYVETFGKVHWSYFKAYITRLMKLQFEEFVDKDDLMGAEDGSRRQGFFSMKPSLKSRSTVFTIGNRATILEELEAPILVPHAAKEAKESGGKGSVRYPYEKLFRSMQFAMMDNSAREFLFGCEFFGMQDDRCVKFFSDLMGKTMALLLKHEETRIANWYDSISLVLCARIIHEYKKKLLADNIPCLEPYFSHLLALIYPRFSQIVDLNVASIAAVDPSKLNSIDARPHFIVRRYAEYSGALLLLNEGVELTEVTDALGRLRQEVANFILRMAAEFPQRKEQLVFLINNYDMMISVYNERTTNSSEEMEEFRGLLNARIREYADEALSVAFGGIKTFVKDTERALSQAEDPNRVPVDEKRILTLTRGFARDWKTAITDIDGEVMKSFTNFKNGTAILQVVLTQLVMTYEQFTSILKQAPFRRQSGWPDLIDKHHVMVEVKKHKTTF
eukprot:m.14879 g.14879  ORF g.14879 m.14879 type:complete len:694 (+) comp5237_c0_seq1:102-2183(+)